MGEGVSSLPVVERVIAFEFPDEFFAVENYLLRSLSFPENYP